VVAINQSTSSVVKGETLADTVRTMENYSDVLVLRHPQKGAAASASAYLTKPIINAGDGTGEHPTQALLDAFTIREELGHIHNLNVTMVGDLKNGRTVHSLARLLQLFDVKLQFVSPAALAMPDEVLADLKPGSFTVHENLDSVIKHSDVLYVTRVQKERFEDVNEYNKLKGSYVITPQTLAAAKERMIVLHPLPRVDEISEEVDTDPRAAYFRQMGYGVYVRMALLIQVLGVDLTGFELTSH